MLLGEKNDKVGILDILSKRALGSGRWDSLGWSFSFCLIALRKTKLKSLMNALNSLRSNSRANNHKPLFAKSF